MRIITVLTPALLLGLFSCKTATINISSLQGWSIVVAEDAIPAEKYAAQEFQSLFRQLCGINLPVTGTFTGTRGRVLIGRFNTADKEQSGFTTTGLGDEGLRIRIRKDYIAIAGGRPRGALYGVYEFFERYLGVRFLTFDHTYFPDHGMDLRIPCEEYSYTPPFSFRWSYYKENSDHPELAARLRINTVTTEEHLGGITPQNLINHSLYLLLPVEKYGKSHPEYFALVNGERKLEAEGGGPQICVTNPMVIRIVAEGVLATLEQNPQLKNTSVSQNDNDAYCRCPDCEAINQNEGTPMAAHLAFVNAVAEIVAHKRPDVKIGTLAYWYTRKPPKTIRPRENVQIQLCSIECCTLHPLNDPTCKKNLQFADDLAQWKKICTDIWVWSYNTDFSFYDLTFPNLRSIGPNIDYFSRNNVKGVFMQANAGGNAGEMCDLRNYVTSRCLWHPGLSSWELTQEFCRLHYAESAKPILEYFKLLHDNAESSGEHPTCFAVPPELGLHSGLVKKMAGYFQQALTLAGDERVRQRVEKASICVYRAMIEAGGRLHYIDGRYFPQYPEGSENVIEQYLSLCKKHQMTMANEGMTLQQYEEKLQKIATGVPAARLENATWRLTMIPENNGQVVEWLHKPSGHNLLAGTEQNLYRGTFEERGRQGINDRNRQPFSVRIDGSSMIMEKVLPQQCLYRRKITLSAGHADRVECETNLIHLGAKPAGYQFLVHPEFDIQTRTSTEDAVAIYARDQQWHISLEKINPGEGAIQKQLNDATGGAFAFYNCKAGFGVVASFDPIATLTPRVYVNLKAGQLNLELLTPVYALATGDSVKFCYAFEYRSAPPSQESSIGVATFMR